MNDTVHGPSPTGRYHIIPAAVIAAGLTAPVAWSAPGDHDETFGNYGRAELPVDLAGAVWATAAGPDGYEIAGGDEYCGYWTYCDNDLFQFSGRLDPAGHLAAGYSTALPIDLVVQAVAWQPDGKLVGAGWNPGDSRAVIFRLDANGQLDPTFGTGGIADGPSPFGRACTVIVDPGGRIVVLYLTSLLPTLYRLLGDGTVDATFGTAGTAVLGPVADGLVAGAMTTVPDGAYRMLGQTQTGQCRLLGFLPSGAADLRLGPEGYATVRAGDGSPLYCIDLDRQSDGALMIGGANDGAAEVVRLAADGTPDPAYHGDVTAQLVSMKAISVAPDDATYVVGPGVGGVPGAAVVRLLPSGAVDTDFGDQGRAWIDPGIEFDDVVDVTSLVATRTGEVAVGGRILAAGEYWYGKPFLIRLTTGGEGPGMIGVETTVVSVAESAGEAHVVVRRYGGSKGPVSVTYRAAAHESGGNPATPVLDFEPVAGRLDWPDGDASDRTINVPIVPGSPAVEVTETLLVRLEQAEGVGLGRRSSLVSVYGDDYPNGSFSVRVLEPTVTEGTEAAFVVHRDRYGEGGVSVRVTAASDTATPGKDFDPTTVVLTWRDGEMSDKVVYVPVKRDRSSDGGETLRVNLTDATGGAVIAPDAGAAVLTIRDSDGNKNSGGGATGPVALLWLGLLALLRRHRRAA